MLRNNGRPILIDAWSSARAEYANVRHERDELLRQLTETRQQRDEALAHLADLCASVRRQWQAEAETRRLRELQCAEREARDPAQRLH